MEMERKDLLARRLQQLMSANGMTQSELARRSNVARDAISTYVRGLSYPEPRNLGRLAEAFGLTPAQLMESVGPSADTPVFEVKQVPGRSDVLLVRFTRVLSMQQTAALFELLNQPNPTGPQ